MTTPLPPIDVAQLPADVRKAGPGGQKLYATALAFEKVLVTELTKQLDPSQSDDGSDSSDGSSDGTTALYTQMLPEAFATGITDAGGVGLAHALYTSLSSGGTK
jgi:Rod binding domain-containing protein